MRSAERRTLERLGLGAGCRMACVSRVEGPVVVNPQPALEAPSESTDVEPRRLAVSGDHALQRANRRVVVIGAGVAGVTAAEEIRRTLPGDASGPGNRAASADGGAARSLR
jgi:nitrite reductase (NADH) large subunit